MIPDDTMTEEHYDEAKQVEHGLLGAVLLSPSTIDHLPDCLGTKFNDSDLGRAFDHVCQMHQAGIPVGDSSRVVSELRQAGLLDRIGGSATVLKAVANSLAYGADWYAVRVRELHAMRCLVDLGVNMALSAKMPTSRSECIRELAEAELHSLDDSSTDEIITLGDMVANEVTELTEAVKAGKRLGLPIGMSCVDDATGGLFPGELTIVGARPSIGKTALGIELTSRLVESGRRVLFVSLEMTAQQLAHRFLCRETGLPVKKIQSASLIVDELAKLMEAKYRLKQLPFRAFCTSTATIGRIHSRARLLRAREGLDAVVVDYLALVSYPGRLSQYERITNISRELKQMAMALNVPLVVLSQLNRESEKASRWPTLSDLRDSGSIEQDADNVWLLHREDRAATESKLIIAKQRQGAVGTLDLKFEPNTMKFFGSGEGMPFRF
jgi:replicative DNA helicase